LGTNAGQARGGGAEVGRQIVLPFSKAFEIAWKGIQIRLWRSLITMSGVILAIAFLMSVWTSSAIQKSLQAVNEDDPNYPLVQRALQQHAIATQSLRAVAGIVGSEEERLGVEGIPRHLEIRRYLQPMQECDPFVVPNDLEAFKSRLSGNVTERPDALVVTGIPPALRSMEGLEAMADFVREGGTLLVLGGQGLLPQDADPRLRERLAELLPADLSGGTVQVEGPELTLPEQSPLMGVKWGEHPLASFLKTKGKRGAKALASSDGQGLIWSISYGNGEVFWYPVAEDEAPFAASLDWVLRKGFLVNVLRWSARAKIQGGAATKRNLWLVTLSLLVCVVGITNAMLMSVTERFREIGTMKCLGALDKFVVKLFVIESALQGIVGSLVGVMLGFLLSFLLGIFTFRMTDPATEQAHWLVFSYFPARSILLWAAVAVVVGAALSVVAAVYPAYRAAKMEPVEAMRVEA